MSIKVLIIDDSRVVREATRFMLESAGYAVQTHAGGSGVLETVGDFGPDVVLVDLGLGDVSGADLARDIRARWQGGRPAVVLYSGEEPSTLARIAKEAGAAGALQKTSDTRRFVEDFVRLTDQVLAASFA